MDAQNIIDDHGSNTLLTLLFTATAASSAATSAAMQPQDDAYLGRIDGQLENGWSPMSPQGEVLEVTQQGLGNTGKGILIGMLSAFGTAALVGIILAIVYFFRYTSRGRILLDRMSRPGEFDDEQAFLREEENAMASMDELQRQEYLRAKGLFPVLQTRRLTD